ncbi:MAG: 4-alpha-glucanotransferase [Bryobacteraceae bacterium]
MSIPCISFLPAKDAEEALERAASLWRIEREYWDIFGVKHTAQPGVVRAILRAMGVPCETQQELDSAVEERLWREWSQPLPPVVFLDEREETSAFPLTMPKRALGSPIEVEFHLENGSILRYEPFVPSLQELEEAELRKCCFVRLRIPLPIRLPLGYHELKGGFTLDGERVAAGTRLIVAPDRAWLPPELARGGRTAGVAVNLYGLRSDRNWGCGDFTDIERLAEWASKDAGADFIALNPLHAIHNRQPFNTSPYLPVCIYYRNPIYLDVERVEDFRSSTEALNLFSTPEVQAETNALRVAPFVEYEKVYALKLRFLCIAYRNFLQNSPPGSPRAEAFRDFCEREGELLERYAIYCALDESIHAANPEVWVWTDWPEGYQDPGSEGTRRFAEEHVESVRFHKYLQWQVELQLARAQQYAREQGLSIGLYHDLALATDRFGSDFWAHRDSYVSGCRVGSPPDDFSPEGQDWAFPPPNSEHQRETGYKQFIESIRRNCCHGGALRIDHVMRFFRLFWIPDGMKAAEGTYVRDYPEDLLRILALESVRNHVLIVGEDLGTVGPQVREELARFGILSYRLLYFEKNKRGELRRPDEYPEQALVSITTHDLPTLAGFWLNRDIEARRRAGLLGDESVYEAQLADRAKEKQLLLNALVDLHLLPDWFPRNISDVPELGGELHNAVVGFLAETPSKLMLLTLEDLTKEVDQQNLPGSTWQYPNWRRKALFTVAELRESPQARDYTAMFRNWLEKTGRAGC